MRTVLDAWTVIWKGNLLTGYSPLHPPRPGQARHAHSEVWLARQLRSLGVFSHTMGDRRHRAKGYQLSDFAPAFARFLREDPPCEP